MVAVAIDLDGMTRSYHILQVALLKGVIASAGAAAMSTTKRVEQAGVLNM